ncbi:MAG: LysE family translocator [Sutterellaceae bacterium]|nr:LysE family translocator [Sutterellaceae bacterium]
MTELFALYLATSAANILAPGLGVVIVVTMSLQYGLRKAAWACLATALGIALLFMVAVSGIGVIITTSPTLFAAIKLAGAFFLFYLGIKKFVVKPKAGTGLVTADQPENETDWGVFTKCVVIAVANPQPIVFALSVLPQFIDPNVAYIPQVSLMIVSYAVMVFVFLMGYATLAAKARTFLNGPRGVKLVHRASGTVFIAIALYVLYRTFI